MKRADAHRAERDDLDLRWFARELRLLAAARAAVHLDAVRKDDAAGGRLLRVHGHAGDARLTSAVDVRHNLIIYTTTSAGESRAQSLTFGQALIGDLRVNVPLQLANVR